MKPAKLILLALAVVTAVICVSGVLAVTSLRKTVIVFTFDGPAPTPEQVKTACEILRERIKAFGDADNVRSGKVEYREPEVVVTLRGYKDLSGFSKTLLRKDEVHLQLAADPKIVEGAEKTGSVPDGLERRVIVTEFIKLGDWQHMERSEESILLQARPEMTITRMKSVKFERHGIGRQPVLTLEFEAGDGKRFAEITAGNIGRRLALVVEGEVFTAPVIEGEIPDGVVQIQNIVNAAQALRLYNILRIGALPVPLKVARIEPPAKEAKEVAASHG